MRLHSLITNFVLIILVCKCLYIIQEFEFMRKYLVLYLCFFSIQTAFCQVDLFNFKLISKGHKKVIAFENEQKSLHYIFLNKSELDINWFTAGERKNVIVPIEKQCLKSKIIASIANDTTILIFFYEHKTKSIHQLSVDKFSQKNSFKIIKNLKADEQLLKCVVDQNQLHILSMFSSNILSVTSIKFSTDISTKDYEIPFQGFYKTLSNELNQVSQEIYSEVGINLISHDVANNLTSTSSFEKLYFLNDFLYFTFDDAQTTHLIRVNLNLKKCDYKKLNFKLENSTDVVKGNSFIIANKLLRVTVNKAQLNLCVVNLDSFSLVKNYNLYPDKDFAIQNTPIITENNGNPDPEFLNSEDFFRNIINGNVAIAANIVNNNQIEIMIGSEELATSQIPSFGSGGPGLINGGTSLSLGWGLGGMPGFYPGWGGPSNTTTYTLTTYFKSLFHGNDFSHIPGALSKNIIDKLHEFEDRGFGNNPPDIHTIYKSQSKIHYGYYTKWNNSFYVVEF